MGVGPAHSACLDGLPRMGWIDEPTPITPLDALAGELGLDYLGVKRDDLSCDWLGGTKIRKLDVLLCAPRFAEARRWVSVGSIGSGHLVALARAAARLRRRLTAHVFWEEPDEVVTRNLALIAGGPTDLVYHGSRLSLFSKHPRLVLGTELRDATVIPPGATNAEGTAGLVLAGLELADQVAAGDLPPPDRIYVPYGTGGIVAGLSIGLALGGLTTRIVAVAATERVVATEGRLHRLRRDVLALLRAHGLDVPETLSPVDVVIDRSQLGPGYAYPTRAAARATRRLAQEGVELERTYSAKAMAALLADAQRTPGGRVVFWLTPHARQEAVELNEAALPAALRRRLHGRGRTTRRALLFGAAGAATLGLLRVGFYPWAGVGSGRVLSTWEKWVVARATEAIVPTVPGGELRVPAEEVASNVDRYLVGTPSAMQAEIHQLMAFIEHGTLLGAEPFGGHLLRFTRLDPAARLAHLEQLARRDDDLAVAARALRDLCLLGYYQDERTWPELGYEGPMGGVMGAGRYASMRASARRPPRAWVGPA